MSDFLGNLLRTCSINDPLQHATCLGITQNSLHCQNRVSKTSPQMARLRLELLATRPADSQLKTELRAVAELLLCKRRHRDQSARLCQQWYDHLRPLLPESAIPAAPQPTLTSGHVPSAQRGERERTAPPRLDDISSTSTSIAARADPAPSRTEATAAAVVPPRAREITVDMIRTNRIPFHVSSTQPARVSVASARGAPNTLKFRSFERGRSIADVRCTICKELDLNETVYVNCEECVGGFHWECMHE